MVERKRAGTTRSQSYHHGDLRRALLDRALQIVSTRGVESLTMSGLARDLSVSVAAPFRHFATREDLLIALCDEGVGKLVHLTQAATEELTDPLEAQRASGVAYVRFAVQEPGYFRVLCRGDIVALSARFQTLAKASQAAMDPVLGRHRPGVDSARLVRRHAGTLAAQALVYGLSRMIADGLLGPLSPDDAERLAIELTGVLGEGLLAR